MEGFDLIPPGTTPGDAALGVGWAAFTDFAFIGQMVLILLVTLVLAASLAYHPATRRSPSLETLDAPRTFLIYALVGAIITIIVKTMPSMALVVFGIGGLLRFRTNLGGAHDTGRIILVTVIGLACGLELYVVALLTTLIAHLLLFVLQQAPVTRVIVDCEDPERLSAAAGEYRERLGALGCEVLGEQKKLKRGRLTLAFRATGGAVELETQVEAGLRELAERSGDGLTFERS